MIFNRMALLAVIGAVAIPSGRGNGGRALLVSAFSSGARVFARSNSFTPRNAPVAFRTSSVASNNLGLAMSSVAVDTEKLEASLEVTHPAFEVVEKDVVPQRVPWFVSWTSLGRFSSQPGGCSEPLRLWHLKGDGVKC